MYAVDGKMDNLAALRASCVSLLPECTAGAGEVGGGEPLLKDPLSKFLAVGGSRLSIGTDTLHCVTDSFSRYYSTVDDVYWDENCTIAARTTN